MYLREHVMEDDKSLDDSGALGFPINITELITGFLLKYKVTNDSAVASNVEPENTISKIELTDGGTTYMSMTGREAVAIAAYEMGVWPPHWYCEAASANQRITIPILFGRYMGDPEFAFDPRKLTNPQIKVTWAKNALHAADSVSLGIIARVMEGVASPGKCLLTKGVESWTGGSSGVNPIQMWVDHPYRRLFIRSYLYGSLLSSLFSHLKLSTEADKIVFFDCDSAEFQEILRVMHGEFKVRKYDYFETGALDYKNCLIDGRTLAVGTPGTQDLFGMFWASGANYYSTRVYDDSGAETACNIQVQITGEFPHATYCYQFGRPMEPETWLNVSAFKNLTLFLTEGGAAANSVLVQQVVPLPVR